MKCIVIIKNRPSRVIETNIDLSRDTIKRFLHKLDETISNSHLRYDELYDSAIIKKLPDDSAILPHYIINIPKEWYDKYNSTDYKRFDLDIIDDLLNNK